MLLFPLILLFALWATPTFAQWANEPSGSVTLFDCGFSTPTCGGVLQYPYGTSGDSI